MPRSLRPSCRKRKLSDPLGHSDRPWLGFEIPDFGSSSGERTPSFLVAVERLSDGALLARCIERDETAWRMLVRRYRNLVYSTALEVGLDGDDAGDVFQEVWVELHRSVSRIRNPDALPRWLMVATRRLAYKVAIRRRRSISGVSRDLVDPATLSDEAYRALRARQRLEEAFEHLDERCANLLRLLFLNPEKIPYDQIAKHTGLAIGSIGPIRSRCLERLKKLLGEEP